MTDEIDELTTAFLELHPSDAARELERLPLPDVTAVLASAPARVVAPVLAAMQSRPGAAALTALEGERAALVLSQLKSTAVAGILRHVPSPRRAALLDALPAATALTCRALLRYPEDAVGAFTETQVPALNEQSTVAQALDALRAERDDCEGVFVVTQAQRLHGWIAAGRLVQSAATLRLSALAQPIARLPALMPVASAIEESAFTQVARVAVVEHGERLLGAVTLAALRRALSIRTNKPQPVDEASSLGGLAANYYWNAVAGLVQASVGLLASRGRSPK